MYAATNTAAPPGSFSQSDRDKQAFRAQRDQLSATLKKNDMETISHRDNYNRQQSVKPSSSSSLPPIAHSNSRSSLSTKELNDNPTSTSSSSLPSNPSLSSNTSTSSTSTASASIESQWILSVLDDAHSKLTLNSFLHPDILKDKLLDPSTAAAITPDPELIVALREHFHVESQYSSLLENEAYKSNPDDPRNKELKHELELCLSDSNKTVIRLLKNSPALVKRLRETTHKRAPQTLEFINQFSRLRNLLHAKLRLSAEEERSIAEQLHAYKIQEEEDELKISELTERLQVEKKEHTLALQQKDKKIQRLQMQIDHLISRTASDRVAFEKKMSEELGDSERVFRQSERELNKAHDTVQTNLDNEGAEHWRNELMYHRKKHLRAIDVTNLIAKYDADMTHKHDSIIDVKHTYAREKDQLHALSNHFVLVDEERRKIEEEHEAIRKRRDEELRLERKNQQASVLMQQLYGAYYAKNGPKEPKKKKKAKKAKLMWRPPREKKSAGGEGGEGGLEGSPKGSPRVNTENNEADIGSSPRAATAGSGGETDGDATED